MTRVTKSSHAKRKGYHGAQKSDQKFKTPPPECRELAQIPGKTQIDVDSRPDF